MVQTGLCQKNGSGKQVRAAHRQWIHICTYLCYTRGNTFWQSSHVGPVPLILSTAGVPPPPRHRCHHRRRQSLDDFITDPIVFVSIFHDDDILSISIMRRNYIIYTCNTYKIYIVCTRYYTLFRILDPRKLWIYYSTQIIYNVI